MTEMTPKDPDWRARVERIFDTAPFLREVGVQLEDVGPGWCESSLTVQKYHQQQDGVVHAGVVATLADHTAGAAAGTLVDPDVIVLTAEFKINLLRAGRGPLLRCRSEVIKSGRTLAVAQSDVSSVDKGTETLVARSLVTVMHVPKS